MSNELAKSAPINAALAEQVLIGGDLSKLSPTDKLNYYRSVCESLGLNPLTRPFEYVNLNGKLTLYARKDCTDQLRSIRSISIEIVNREEFDGVFTVTARATDPSGRRDEDVGAVSIGAAKGDMRANAVMKAHTKAKRRVTLSICGLGIIDESELETVSNHRRVPENSEDPAEIHVRAEAKLAEAKQFIETKRIEEKKEAEEPFDEENKPPSKPSAWQIKMLQAFRAIKNGLGKDEYYRILGANGYEKSNQITDKKVGESIYLLMKHRLNDIKLEEQERAAIQNAPVEDDFDRHMRETAKKE